MSAAPMSITAAAPNPATTLADVISFLSIRGIDNRSIWAQFDKTDSAKLAVLCDELDKVEAENFDPLVHVGKAKKVFEAEKSGKKGKLFEKISAELMSGLTCFKVHEDVTTATNQLDLLVQVEPSGSIIPALREWGTHFICECKFHDTAVKVDWIQKLHSLLTYHGANVGIIISKKGIASKGRGVGINQIVQLTAIQKYYILNFSRKDLDHCIKNGRWLEMIVDKYVAIQGGIPAWLSQRTI